jgi:hypothetical protein
MRLTYGTTGGLGQIRDARLTEIWPVEQGDDTRKDTL